MREKLVISFSGGETSAFMCQMPFVEQYSDVLYIFANTGQENEETLEFVDMVDKHFNLGVVWVEAEVDPKIGGGTRARRVDFKTADRSGRKSFEPMISKYGIPNMAQPHCTRVLKREPIDNYVHSVFKRGSYDLAIGIRADEIDRVSPTAHKRGIIYPLADAGITKPHINSFWRDMPFRLKLKGYEGNCMWCWKKTLRKHVTIMRENPDRFDFPREMEEKYKRAGALATRNKEDQLFFRKKLTTADISTAAKDLSIKNAEDDAFVFLDEDLDTAQGCSESCEVYTDADEEK